MKNFLNGIAAGLALAVLMFLLIMPSPSHAATPVIDEANVIPDDEEAVLNQTLVKFYKDSGRQVAVVTLKTLNGREIQEVATAKFRELGVGSKELNDGVLFIMAPSERKMRIEVGYGLEEYLTDAKSGRILEGVKPYFRKEEYGPGITYATSAIINTVSPDAIAYATAEKKKEEIKAAKSRDAIGNFFGWVFTILLGIAGLLGFGWLVTLPSRRRKAEEERTAREKLEAEQAERRRIRDAENAAYVKAQEQRRAAERAEENRKAEERARKERERHEKEEREWQEYLKTETVSQKSARLAKEEADRQAKAEAARLAAIEATEKAEKRRAVEAARIKREKEEAEERRRRDSYDSDYYSRNNSSSSSSGWGSSSSSDWGSSSSSSSYDFGGGSSGGGGSDSSW